MRDDAFFAEDPEPPGRGLYTLNTSITTRHLPTPQSPLPSRPDVTAKAKAKSKPYSPRLTVSARSNAFRQRFFPDATLRDWNDWRWQNSHRIRSAEQLARIIQLAPDEAAAIARHQGPLPLAVGPYYASLLDEHNPLQAIRRTVVPASAEFTHTPGEDDDPLGEDGDSPIPGLVHRYPDRVLLLATGLCSTYCRYCTRARLVGASGELSIKKSNLERALEYIET
ncbi:MAG: lysine 2,3-aminomutase, partial [Candidatus Competibacteraceae bacterium]|nr:lysine 2,3-aminomutase [Candidatus Competibacteraceae bacterium]